MVCNRHRALPYALHRRSRKFKRLAVVQSNKCFMQKILAIVRGGPSAEHEVSLKTGASVAHHIQSSFPHEYRLRDVFIDKKGIWHVRGVPMSPEKALLGVDVVWNALHGTYGEDGEVQRVFERLGVSYTGSRVYASSIGMNKRVTKETLAALGVATPHSIVLTVSDSLPQEIVHAFRHFPQPSVIKPLNAGSSVGVSIAKSFLDFQEGIKKAFSFAPQVLIEEYIGGKEATVGVVESLRGQGIYRLPPVEIIPATDQPFFTYEAKYGSKTEERCPGSFSASEVGALQVLAETAHRGLGLRHYSRSDFIVSRRGIYFLEVNTLPGLTETSLLPKSLAAVGVSLPDFIHHVVDLALKNG